MLLSMKCEIPSQASQRHSRLPKTISLMPRTVQAYAGEVSSLWAVEALPELWRTLVVWLKVWMVLHEVAEISLAQASEVSSLARLWSKVHL